LIEMKVAGLAIDPLTDMPILLLRDLDDRRTIPIWIGLVESSAIATELQHVELTRPMTHDLMRQMLVELGVTVLHVEITDLRDNTYYARLMLQQGSRIVQLNARPSDAIAIAMRAGCSLFVEEKVLEKASRFDLHSDAVSDLDASSDMLASLPADYFGKWKM